MTACVWIVASARTATRWRGALAGPGRDVRALGWSDLACVPAALPGGPTGGAFDLLCLTSPNAVACLPPGLPPRLPVACVGEGTAAAARACGLEVVLVGPGTGVGLAELVLRRRPPPRRVLSCRGADARREGVDRLRAAGVEVVEVVVYQARVRPGFAAEVAGAPSPAAIVVGSPGAARALGTAWRGAGRGRLAARLVAVGPTTGAALRELGLGDVIAARDPDVAGLSAALAQALSSDPSA